MTAAWDRVLATGSGALEFRLSIEGLNPEFVTASSMETESGETPPRNRYVGLKREGLGIDEQANLRSGKLKASGITVKIADIAGRATAAFSQKPAKSTWLREIASAVDADIEVLSTSQWTGDGGGVIHINTEAIDADVDDDDTFDDCARGIWDTIPQKHWTEDGEHLRAPLVTDRPQCLEGRRARLYVYAAGDTMTGDGNLIWIGIVNTEPSLDSNGTTWALQLDPLTRILQGDIGEDLEEPVTPRGIYYSWVAPFCVQMDQSATTARAPGTPSALVKVTGPYETQSDFCDALGTAIQTAATAAGLTGTFTATPDDATGGFRIVYFTPAASPLYVTFSWVSAADGWPGPEMQSPNLVHADGIERAVVVADTEYHIPFTSQVPRGTWLNGNISPAHTDPTASTTYPRDRIYLGGTITVDGDMTAAQIEWPSGVTLTHPVDAAVFDADARWITVLRAPGYSGFFYQWPALPEIKLGREYGSGGGFASFLLALCNDAPSYANIGAVPFVTSADFDDGLDLDETTAVVTEAAAGRSFLTARRYLAFGARSLEDWIAEECKMLGIFPCLNSAGRITFRRLKLPVSTEVGAAAITAASTLTKDGFPGWKRNAKGMVNTVIIRTGYDPVEDEHVGRTYVVRDPVSFGINRAPRTDEIAPFSYALLGEDLITVDQIRSVAAPLLSIFGAPYYQIDINVPMTHFGVLLGDVVTLVSAQLPDPDDGTRGWTTAKSALVVGRKWDLATGKGTLTLLAHAQNLAGYAPTMRITADTINDPGTNLDHTLTVSGTDEDGNASAYIPSGTDATNWFAVGYKVRTLEFDAETPATAVGTVTAVTATTIRVTFTSATTTRANHHIGFNDASTASIASAQKAFCFIAGTDGLVDFPSDAQAARQLAL